MRRAAYRFLDFIGTHAMRFLAAAQIPMYLMPGLLLPLYRRLISGRTGAG